MMCSRNEPTWLNRHEPLHALLVTTYSCERGVCVWDERKLLCVRNVMREADVNSRRNMLEGGPQCLPKRSQARCPWDAWQQQQRLRGVPLLLQEAWSRVGSACDLIYCYFYRKNISLHVVPAERPGFRAPGDARMNHEWDSLKPRVCTAILIIIDVRYQLSTVFSTSLLLENR